jgi:hypothetical protein
MPIPVDAAEIMHWTIGEEEIGAQSQQETREKAIYSAFLVVF